MKLKGFLLWSFKSELYTVMVGLLSELQDREEEEEEEFSESHREKGGDVSVGFILMWQRNIRLKILRERLSNTNFLKIHWDYKASSLIITLLSSINLQHDI